uniref:Uncharacterized protein n=1 Tax=Cyprinus carpio TaxID=7962 RepID=A0A8C2PN76_CYPCA
MEGDSFILRINVSKQHHEPMRWYFNDSLITLINGPNTSCLYDGEGGRFRDRLKVDYETGFLTITDIRSEHAGRYEADIIRRDSSGKSQSLNRNPKCDSTKIYKKNIIPKDIIITFSLTVSASDSGKNKNEAQIVPQDKEKKICSGPSTADVTGIVIAFLVVAAAVVIGVMIWPAGAPRNDTE